MVGIGVAVQHRSKRDSQGGGDQHLAGREAGDDASAKCARIVGAPDGWADGNDSRPADARGKGKKNNEPKAED